MDLVTLHFVLLFLYTGDYDDKTSPTDIKNNRNHVKKQPDGQQSEPSRAMPVDLAIPHGNVARPHIYNPLVANIKVLFFAASAGLESLKDIAQRKLMALCRMRPFPDPGLADAMRLVYPNASLLDAEDHLGIRFIIVLACLDLLTGPTTNPEVWTILCQHESVAVKVAGTYLSRIHQREEGRKKKLAEAQQHNAHAQSIIPKCNAKSRMRPCRPILVL